MAAVDRSVCGFKLPRLEESRMKELYSGEIDAAEYNMHASTYDEVVLRPYGRVDNKTTILFLLSSSDKSLGLNVVVAEREHDQSVTIGKSDESGFLIAEGNLFDFRQTLTVKECGTGKVIASISGSTIRADIGTGQPAPLFEIAPVRSQDGISELTHYLAKGVVGNLPPVANCSLEENCSLLTILKGSYQQILLGHYIRSYLIILLVKLSYSVFNFSQMPIPCHILLYLSPKAPQQQSPGYVSTISSIKNLLVRPAFVQKYSENLFYELMDSDTMDIKFVCRVSRMEMSTLYELYDTFGNVFWTAVFQDDEVQVYSFDHQLIAKLDVTHSRYRTWHYLIWDQNGMRDTYMYARFTRTPSILRVGDNRIPLEDRSRSGSLEIIRRKPNEQRSTVAFIQPKRYLGSMELLIPSLSMAERRLLVFTTVFEADRKYKLRDQHCPTIVEKYPFQESSSHKLGY